MYDGVFDDHRCKGKLGDLRNPKDEKSTIVKVYCGQEVIVSINFLQQSLLIGFYQFDLNIFF
jgi:hypothetical protein